MVLPGDMSTSEMPETGRKRKIKPVMTPKSRNKNVKFSGVPGCKVKPMLDQNLKAHVMKVHKTSTWVT